METLTARRAGFGPVAIATAVYLSSQAAFVAYLCFLSDTFLPRTVDRGASSGHAVLIDLALVVIFGLQHSVMARPWCKALITRAVPPALERTIYVLATSLALMLVAFAWQPLPTVVWQLPRIAWGIFATGAVLLVVSTHQLDHLGLFGLREPLADAALASRADEGFREVGLYRFMRHPIQTSLLLVHWGTPTMTVGHLLLAASMTVYVVIGTRLEERALLRTFGDRYRDYMRRVGGLFPKLYR